MSMRSSRTPRLTPVALWRQLTHGVRALVWRTERERDVRDEVEHFLAEARAAGIAKGLHTNDAERLARIEIGGVTATQEVVRSYGWENVVETVVSDIRFAARRLRADLGFTIVVLLTLAIGIGGTTAVFSAVKPVIFDALPYPDPSRVTAIWEARHDGARNDGTFAMYRTLSERSKSFSALAVFKSWQPAMAGTEHPERIDALRVSWRYLDVLGVLPSFGRTFQESDDRPGSENVVVISDGLWRRRFGSDRSIIGRTILLDQEMYSVIGVMPPRFEDVLSPSAALWTPLRYDMSDGRAWGHHLRTIGRIASNVDASTTTQEIDAIGTALLAEQHPATYGSDIRFEVVPLREDVMREARPARLAILGAMLLVLIITCLNVTNLLVARGVRRRGEFALRTALGAARGRIVRQLLTESLLLAMLGGAAGLIVAIGAIKALLVLSPEQVLRAQAIRVDAPVFLFAVALTAIVGIAFGTIPARQAARNDPHRELRIGTSRAVGGHARIRAVLVAAEVALALVLLVGSGLLLQSMQRLFAVDTGFDASRVVTMQIQTSGARFSDDITTRHYFDDVLSAVRRVPGVEVAALTSQLPLTHEADKYGVRFEHGEPQRDGDDPSAFRYSVTSDYIAAMRIPLRSGRVLDASDRAGGAPVALISASYAKRVFAGRDAVGERLRIGPKEDWITIVGVVGDVRQTSLAATPSDAIYLPEAQWPFADRTMTLVVRTRDGADGRSNVRTDAGSFASRIPEAIWSVDPDQAVVRVATMEELVEESEAERRFTLTMFELFALAALALAAAGIYGVIAGSVAERTREFGVRSALGASRRSILTLVLGSGAKLTVIGGVAGLIGSLWASRALGAMLFGISPLDPVTYLAVFALLIGVAGVACAIPAWRAARLDPASTLRSD